MDNLDTVRERFAALEQPTEPLQQQPYMGARWRCWGRYPWRVAAVAVLGLALALPHLAQARTLYCDAGDVTCLIAAITQANANGETNTIRLKAGTYTLTDVDNTTPDGPNGLPSITSPLTIKGEGADTTILERAASAPAFRLVHVAASGHLRLTEVTIRGGGGFNPVFFGFSGAGLYNNGGTVHLVQTTITQNHLGGLFSTGGTIRITRSRFTNNGANISQSGGLQADGGVVLITQSTVTGNSADTGGGIGIGRAAVVTLVDSTVADNDANFAGGISNRGLLLITNSTVAHNTVGIFGSTGSGLENSGGTMILLNATIAENADTVDPGPPGGGLRVSGGTVTLQNTLLASNVGNLGAARDCSGVVTSLGHNLIGDPTGCTITLHPSDLTGDPGLDAFTDNGRPGNGHFPLLPTSQAIDAGSDAVCPRTDQLGRRRIGPCDIGAIAFPGKDHRHDEEDEHHDVDPATAAD